ncbi:N-acetylmuramoyl-L-alanine amidase [Ornithinibacillus salinisoli]|uniref:N-acetylmuramoyl-L-alanine amidase n=1 Tax=Ornithinibacillus salinisoli TaxID=1848459 RepID=A0ABW4W612_9BACI
MTKRIDDPGHGGADPGAQANGIKEKEYTLEAAKYVNSRLKELGIDSDMTRTADVTLDQKDRTAKTSRYAKGISHHYNAGGGAGAEFIHSIYADGKFEKLLAKEFKKAGYPLRPNTIYTRKWGSQDYYFMHRETGNCRVTIVEYDFVDGPNAAKLKNKSYREGMYECVVKAVCIEEGVKYKAVKELTPPKSKGRPEPTDNDRWRIQSGLFDDAESYAKAIDKLEDEYGWLLHEKANSTELNPRYRIVTGLFTGKNVAEYYAEELRKEFGWLVSVIPR